jgi:SAM-dependent methyltransferase
MVMRLNFELNADPGTAFELIMNELSLALGRFDIAFERGPEGRLLDGGETVGRVVDWNPPQGVALEWIPAPWQSPDRLEFRAQFESTAAGTLVVVEQPDWGKRVEGGPSEMSGWIASQLIAPWLVAMAPQKMAEWITDRRARCPSGPQAKATYADPLYHRPNFLVILDTLQLKPDDWLFEIGCGGGAFLKDALKSGCRAAAIDHSADMVRTATEVNRASIEAGRLEIRQADAGTLPFAPSMFTCAVMTGVFGFIDNPAQVLSEILRVLAPGGQLVLYTGTKELQGTPAAPEPIASWLHFYEDEELSELARRAGFSKVRVDHPDFAPYARTVGIPDESMPFFQNRNAGQLLVAYKSSSRSSPSS